MSTLNITDYNGWVKCRSSFYSAQETCHNYCVEFKQGLNVLRGDVDSSGWAINYGISMLDFCKKPDIAIEYGNIVYNGKSVNIKMLSEHCCYMDECFPLFKSKSSVYSLIKAGLRKTSSSYSAEDVCRLFELDDERVKRSVNQSGNERFRAMSAIGFAYSKDVFCFPWISKVMFLYYGKNLIYALSVLSEKGKIVILPTSIEIACFGVKAYNDIPSLNEEWINRRSSFLCNENIVT